MRSPTQEHHDLLVHDLWLNEQVSNQSQMDIANIVAEQQSVFSRLLPTPPFEATSWWSWQVIASWTRHKFKLRNIWATVVLSSVVST